MRTRLSFSAHDSAQAFADRVHAWMVANHPDYARSVQAGDTTAWAIPYQDRDVKGQVVGTDWYVNLKDRSLAALTPTERTQLRS